MTNTNTAMPTPTCENCGRDKTPTYICDACCDKMNAATRAITAERDEWRRRCEAISKAVDLSHDGILESITVAESLIVLATTLGNIIAIAEGRDNG